MIRRWLAGVAAMLCAAAVLLLAQPAAADVTGRWLWNCATGSTTSATVSADGQSITVTGTITPCGVAPLVNSYAWIVYTTKGEAVLSGYLGGQTLTPRLQYRVAYGASAICLAYSPSPAGRLGCYGVDIGPDGTVTAPPIPTNDPRLVAGVVVVGPNTGIVIQPNCATCV